MTTIPIAAILAAQPNPYNVEYEGIQYRLNDQGDWAELSGSLTFTQQGITTRMLITAGPDMMTPIGISWGVRPTGSKIIQAITAFPTYIGGQGSPYLQVAGLPITSGPFAGVLYLDGPDEDVTVSSIAFLITASSSSPCPSQPSYPAQGQRWPWGMGPRNDTVTQPGCPPIPVYPVQGQRWPWGFQS